MQNYDDKKKSAYGHYQLRNQIGSGGMGEVLLGYDTRLERTVAIKRLKGQCGILSARSRLQQEAKLLAKLNHPGIVQLYDIIDDGRDVLLVMEYIKGINLNLWLASKPRPLTQILDLAIQIADALEYAHRQNIIHRDLKGENILINDESRIKITDFGIGKILNNKDAIPTQDGTLLGSYISMSPEQILGLPVDRRCDLFSLGLLLFYMLTGRHAFGDANDPLTMIHRIAHQDPEIEQLSVRVKHPQITALIASLLAKDVDNRPAGAYEVAKALSNIANKGDLQNNSNNTLVETTEISGSQDNATSPESIHAKTNDRQALVKYIVAFFVVFTLVAGGYIHQKHSSPENIKFVAVATPTLSIKNNHNYFEQFSLDRVIENAIEEKIIASKELNLVPKTEIQGILSDTSAIRKSTGADYLIKSDIFCEEKRCNIHIYYIDTNLNAVLNKATWPFIPSQTLSVYSSAQESLSSLLKIPIKSSPLEEKITADNFIRFINLEHAYNEGEIYYPDALAALPDIIESAPKFLPLYEFYSRVAIDAYFNTLQADYLDNLKHQLDQIQRLSPESIKLQRLWLLYYSARSDSEKVSQIMETIASSNELSQYEKIRLKARTSTWQANYREARGHYQALIELKPTTESYRELAKIQYLLGDIDEARASLAALFNLSSNDYYGLTYFASTLLYAGKLDLAADTYLKLLEKHDNTDNHANLGLVYMLKGDYGSAIHHFQKVVTLSKSNPEDLLNLADTYLLMGDTVNAENLYQQIVRMSTPSSIEDEPEFKQSSLRIVRAQALAHLGKFEESIEVIQQLSVETPKDSDVVFSSALIYTLAGEHLSALAHIKQAKKLNLGDIWFVLPWFKPLCDHANFQSLLAPAFHATLCTRANQT